MVITKDRTKIEDRKRTIMKNMKIKLKEEDNKKKIGKKI